MTMPTPVPCATGARSGGVEFGIRPNTSRPAFSAIAWSIVCLPCAYAPSMTRSQSRLIRRGTPREISWIRCSALRSNGIARVMPATERRWRM